LNPPRVIKVIETTISRGNGKDEIYGWVFQYHTLDGKFLAEKDPFPNGKNKQ